MSARPACVLLVEDDPQQQASYAGELIDLGYRVVRCDSAEDGIAFAQVHRVDVILTDNILPGMTGLRSIAEYARACRAPVLLMTSHPSPEAEQDARLLGAWAYHQKPLDVARLDRDLQAALRCAETRQTA